VLHTFICFNTGTQRPKNHCCQSVTHANLSDGRTAPPAHTRYSLQFLLCCRA